MAWTEEQQAEAVAILTEIAEGDPTAHIEARFDSGDDIHMCRYCHVEQAWPYNAPVHEGTCLYVRARRLMAGGTARRG